jgi:hypothetical protein
MPRKPKTVQADSAQKTLWDILEGAEALSKEEVAASSKLDEGRMEYSPVDQTAKYVERAVRFEEVWETTIAKARERLLKVDPRELFMDFFDDLVTQAKAGGPKAGRYVVMLDLNQSTRDWDTLVRLQTRPWWGRHNPRVPMFCGSI